MGTSGRRTVRDLRRGNRAMLLRALYFGGPASRNELSATTGLSAATVSTMTAGLLESGVVVEAGQVDSDGGRPRVLLKVNPAHGYAVGVDVGETQVKVELFDLAMNVRAGAHYAVRSAKHDPELVARHILTGVDAVIAESEVPPAQVLGVGVGVPGIVEPGPGALVRAKTFGWEAVPLGALLRAGTELPLYVDNGAKTMGQAELWFGSGQGARDAIILLVGSGVGGTVVTDGRIYRGAGMAAGEVGHLKIVAGGRACRCGARGCLEAYLGAEAILDRAGVVADSADEESALARLLEEGSPVIGESVELLGVGLSSLVHLFNPERVVIGGWAGLMLGGRLLAEIRAAAAANTQAQPFQPETVVLGRLGPDAVALGAATLVVEPFLSGAAYPESVPTIA
ncbi:putative NBD/HSP70 family sugar kinase [Nonomuraea fuscirosea]|uniref:Putative NBD/HSP70 family sugar kinase n=1 Tax=Nonomuraea fuscirosea TaxID=1291556 RepID=A0A2T0MNU3_9ACTN|nr:ROK family protein [Nonomuraea fuscirosea]PRX59657.1 putative NBD/HSP70 family sugar kinase [Nonomuraea fuscirosea]